MAHAVRDHDAPESLVRRDFASPPVTEVVLSVALQPLALGVTDLVDLWRRYFQKTFPSVEEQPPFTMPIGFLTPLLTMVLPSISKRDCVHCGCWG